MLPTNLDSQGTSFFSTAAKAKKASYGVQIPQLRV